MMTFDEFMKQTWVPIAFMAVIIVIVIVIKIIVTKRNNKK